MATKGVRRLHKLLKERFAPYLRGKAYQETFEKMLHVLTYEEFDDTSLTDLEAIYLFFNFILLDGFERIERLEKILDMEKRRMF